MMIFRSPTLKGKKKLPQPADILHAKLGAWDLYYQELNPDSFALPSWLTTFPELYDELVRSLPCLERMVKDIIGIKQCQLQLVLFIAMELLQSLLPAVELW